MTAIERLERQGYAVNLAIDYALTSNGEPPPDSAALLSELAANKGAALLYLSDRLYGQPAPPEQGGKYTVILKTERDIWRYALAREAGLISIEGKVIFNQLTSHAKLTYRTLWPDEWLEEAITDYIKKKYKAVMERISKGEAWLLANSEHPDYERMYAKFLGLFPQLATLYDAIGEADMPVP